MSELRSEDPETLLEQANWLSRLARGLVRDENAADDLAQETWIAAWTHRPRGGASDLRAWMSVVLRNFARRSRRDEGLRASHEPGVARGEALPGPAEIAERVELQQKLAGALLTIDEPLRSALVLRYFDDLSTIQVAERLGISHAAARQRISRGLAKLRERLDREHRGGRAGWTHALLLFRPTPAPSITGGLLLMGTKAKIALLVAFAALGVWLWRGSFAPSALEYEAASEMQVALVGDSGPQTSPDVTETPTSEARIALAAPGEDRKAAPATEPDLLRGIVLDPANRPVEGALVTASSSIYFDYSTLDQDTTRLERAETTRTGADGRFALELAPGPSYQVAVESPRFAPATFGRRHAGETLTVRLSYAASLEGHVTRGEARAPLAGARIHCFLHGNHSLDGARFERWSVTDALGFYRFDPLPAGILHVEATAPGEPSSGWIEVHPEAGKTITQDIHLLAKAWIRGVVADAATHVPVAGAQVSTYWRMRNTITTDESGRFALPVDTLFDPDEGIYVRASGYGFRAVPVPTNARRSGAEGVEVLLEPARAASGRVTDTQGRPIGGAYVAACAYELAEPQRFDWIGGRTDAGGRYALSDLRSDLPHSLFVRAAGFGSAVYEFPQSEASGPWIDVPDVVLRPAGSISGRVVDDAGRPVSELEVSLRGTNADRSRWNARGGPGLDTYVGERIGRTDERGRFTFDELAAGDFEVQLRRDSHRPTAETTVSLSASERRTGVELVLASGLTVKGRVLDRAGESVRSVYVSIEPTSEGLSDCDVQTDDDGRFVARGIVPGKYWVQLWPPSPGASKPEERLFAHTKFVKEIAGEDQLDLVISDGAWLTGLVVDAEGNPLAGASVSADAIGSEGGGRLVARTDDKGVFRLAVERDQPLVVDARWSPEEGFPRRYEGPECRFGRVTGVLGGGPEVRIVMTAR